MRQNQSIDRIIAIIDTRSSVMLDAKIHIKYIKLLIISTIENFATPFSPIEAKSNITSRKVSEFLLSIAQWNANASMMFACLAVHCSTPRSLQEAAKGLLKRNRCRNISNFLFIRCRQFMRFIRKVGMLNHLHHKGDCLQC